MAGLSLGENAADEHTETCRAFPPSGLGAALARYTTGSVLSGKYVLGSLLGEGGMGSVWRATNLLLDLPVAIKLIRADLDHHALRARLELEARSVAKLGHPAIVRIYDVGETEQGDPFIVMELLHGQTLAQLLANGRLSGVRAVQLLLPIIDACATAHARGIVHRDLKPDNLLIALEGQRTQPKILDFGVAKLTDPRDADHRLTEIGTVVGSPDYMSPEQARGRDDVDYRTDIWSLCVLLYECITGTTPFCASNYNALLRAIVEDDPPPLLEHAAGDAQLWEILRKGLAKEREARHRSMGELGRALAAWLSSHGVQEDACGTSVDSKWLASSSDSYSVADPAENNAPHPGAAFSPHVTQDSRARRVDSRGPFTATIRPNAGSRQRTLRAAALACALIGGLTGISLLSPKERARATFVHAGSVVAGSEVGAPTAPGPVHEKPSAAPAASAASAEVDSVPTAEAPPQVKLLATPSLLQAQMARPRSAALTPAPASPRVTHAMSSAVPVGPAAKASVPRRDPVATPSARELDLISPY